MKIKLPTRRLLEKRAVARHRFDLAIAAVFLPMTFNSIPLNFPNCFAI